MIKMVPFGGLIKPVDIGTFGNDDFIMIAKIMTFGIFIVFTQWLTGIMLKKSPLIDKNDEKIPIYHIVIAITVSMMLFTFGWSMDLVKGTAFLLILMFASVCDIQTHEVRDFVSVMIVLVALIGVEMTNLPTMLIGGCAIFAFLFVCAMVSGNRFGGADVKLSAACAFLLGFQKSILGLIIGLFLAVICNFIIERKSKIKEKPFPLVPYLSFGFMLMYFF